MDQVFLALAHNGFNIGQLATGKDGNKNLDRKDFTRIMVDDGLFVTGIVYEHFVTGFMVQVHDGTRAIQILLDKSAETATGITVRMLAQIFFVKHLAGDTLFL